MSIQNETAALNVKPFATDLEYLTAELAWVHARTRRIEASQLTLEQDPVLARVQSGRIRAVYTDATASMAGQLAREEETIRQEIDARLALNRADGPGLGLDRLCLEHGLGQFERAALLLATIPCLGYPMMESHVMPLRPRYSSTTIDAGIVSLFLELDMKGGLEGLLSLLPDAPLRKAGLVALTYEPRTPASVLDAGFELTGKTLAAITGIPGFAGFADPDLLPDVD
ncbi:MAG TPA: hypothetical protein PLB35_04945 [Myxococcota bacterium]|nr:hypothetical protein [Myxococcota bacterium]HOH76581.1 hypothetical protein [Myxococcota bacterium]HPV04965.1 hypothetical protein [Myxococcota bacterium]